MASPRSLLRIVQSTELGSATRALDVVRVDGAEWANVRGKYVILDTGLVLPDGKAVKRAYSLTPVEEDPRTCRLIVKRLAGGPGSSALHEAPIGTELSFSGPWGKLVPEGGIEGTVLFVATDTGITSALGVATRGYGESLTVLWLRSADESFLDVEVARARVVGSGARFLSATIPPLGAAARVQKALALVDACVAEVQPRVLLAAGDGHIVFPLKDRAFSPFALGEVRIECFFHNPERKSA